MNLKDRIATGALALALPFGAATHKALAQEQENTAIGEALTQTIADAQPQLNAAPAQLTKDEIERQQSDLKDAFDDKRKNLSPADYANLLSNAVIDGDGTDEEKQYALKNILHISDSLSDADKMNAIIKLMTSDEDKSRNVNAEDLHTLVIFRDAYAIMAVEKEMGPDKFIKDYMLPRLLSKTDPKDKSDDASITTTFKTCFEIDEKATKAEIATKLLAQIAGSDYTEDLKNPKKETLQLLVDMGADRFQKDENGRNLMFDPAGKGNLEMLQMLHDLGVPLAADHNNRTPLGENIKQPKVVKKLLELGAAAEGTMSFEQKETYLAAAFDAGQLETAQALINHNANINAVIQGEPLAVRLLQKSQSPSTQFQAFKMMFKGLDNNKLYPNTHSSDGEDLYSVLARNSNGEANAMMQLFAFHDVPVDLNDKAVSARLTEYLDDISIGKEMRTFDSLSVLPPDRAPGERLMLSVILSDNDRGGDSVVDRVMSNAGEREWFNDFDDKRAMAIIAMRYNPGAFERLLTENPDILTKADPNDKSFSSTDMLESLKVMYIESQTAENIVAQLKQVSKMGETIDIDLWKKAIFTKSDSNQRDAAKPIIDYLDKLDALQKNPQTAVDAPASSAVEPIAPTADMSFYNAIVTGDVQKIGSLAATDTLAQAYVTDRTVTAIGSGMHLAAGAGQIESAKKLKSLGLSYNAPNNFGETPVVDAVRSGQEKMFRFLADQKDEKIDLGVRTQGLDWTLLDWAVDSGDKGTVSAVIEKGILSHITRKDVTRAATRAQADGYGAIAETINAALSEFLREPQQAGGGLAR